MAVTLYKRNVPQSRTHAGAEAQAAASQPLANTSHYTVSYLKADI